MVSEDTLHRLIHGAYDAALDQSGWPRFLDDLAEALNGTLTALFVHDFRSLHGMTISVARGDPDYARQYNDHYHSKNVYVTRRPEVITLGRVLTTDDLCPERDVLRSEIYADWMSPQDIFWTTGAAVLNEDSVAAMITSLRPHRAPPFGKEEVALQAALYPHVHRALQLQRRLGGLERTDDAVSGALDHLPIGVILIGEDRHPLTLNRTAREIVDEGDGLGIDAEGLCAAVAEETVALRAAVRAAGDTCAGDGASPGGVIRLTRPSSKRPMDALVVPLPRRRLGLSGRMATVAVFVSDPERTATTPLARLVRLYHLTRAESRLLAALVEGCALNQAAQKLDVSVETVRSQMKRIFEKTGTSRQADLLRVVLGSPATVRSGP